MDKLKMHSPDITQRNIEKLLELFPSCKTEKQGEKGDIEAGIDFDLLKQELSKQIVEGPQERYQLNWPGKREALLTANAPIAKTLRPCREESVNFDTTQNLFIEGDNLDALKLLQENYLGKVKMIYIDPPYNTGNDFIYDDDFSEDQESFLVESEQKDQQGNRLVANTDANGRFHSDWMSMIYSRIKLARNLLADNGVVFISIDDCEYHNLRKICDEIFGADNFVDNIVWKKRYGGGAKEKHLVSLHEYVLVFAKKIEALENFFIPLAEDSIKRYYKLKDVNFEKRGPYRTHPLEATKSMGERPNLVYSIPGPDGKDIMPQRQWLWGKQRTFEALENSELEFVKTKNGGFTVHSKQYLIDENGERRKGKPFSIVDDVFTQHGTNEIIELFGNAQIFSFPKPSKFVKRLVEIATRPSSNDIIIDFFCGSGTTFQSVFTLNSEDGGNRRIIGVQLPELVDEKSEAFKSGYTNIAQISKERIIRAANKIKNENPESVNLDMGFRVLNIDSSNMSDVYYTPDTLGKGDLFAQVEHIKSDRTEEDLLFQVLLDWGVDLTLPIRKETIQGKPVFFVDDNALVACFEKGGITEELIKELASLEPLRVVFRDDGFVSDSVKINAEQIFKQLAPNTDIKAI